MNNKPAYLHNGQAISREGFYAIACDPQRSVAVQACAGAGKTWMLVSRILRALLEGAHATPPVLAQDILAITFTKKAAGEMRARLNEWLEEFAHMPLPELEHELRIRGFDEKNSRYGIADNASALQNLYQSLLQGGRSVQIRTFHSWFATLLRNAPMALLQEMGLPAQYELLEQDAEALALVWPRFFQRVAAAPESLNDFETSVRLYGRSQTLKALATALSKRVEFLLAEQHHTLQDSVLPFGAVFAQYAALARPEDALSGDLAHQRWHARSKALAQEKNKTPQKAAEAVVDAFLNPDLVQRLALLRKAFFVATEDRLTAHLTKFDAATEAEAELQALCGAAAQHEAWQHQQRMVRLTRIAIDEYARLKRERGWIDMNDVEQAAQAMLNHEELSGWLQQRLDARTRHLLIDEFQDTSPLQWQTLHTWLSSYAGSGGGMAAPKVFIVGDPKQSIYRFRRAEPQVFKAALAFVVNGLGGDALTCDHTHRNAPEVVQAVNDVMLQAQGAGEFDGFNAHTTESDKTGEVLALPAIERDAALAADDGDPEWRNSLSTPRDLPEVTLRTQECRQAARWIAEQLNPKNGQEARKPADIMVLARKRVSLSAMQDALRELHIPASQPEKADLGASPEVADIVALLDAMLSPEHDLSLAQALKSPIFGASDDDLTLLAQLQRQTGDKRACWWDILQSESLQKSERLTPVLYAAAGKLTAWQHLVQTLPPHDALQTIFDQGDLMARFVAAAPAAARNRVQTNLRALLGAALNHQGGRFVTPYALVRALKAGKVMAPPAASPDAVQLLTVHGATGLEAHTVLLMDTDGTAARAETMATLIDWPGEAPAPTRFSFLLREKSPPVCNRSALLAEQTARQREELNGLYVAMTRARQRLVLSSTVPARPQANSWWARIQPLAVPAALPDEALQLAPNAEVQIQMLELPFRHNHQAFIAIQSEAILPAKAADAAYPLSARLGEAMHRLLEWGPQGEAEGPSAQRRWTPAQLHAATREFALDAMSVAEAHDMAQRIRFGEAAWAWDASILSWQGNEVPITWRGQTLRLDRLVQRADDGSWWVLDYKSAPQPEKQSALRQQLQQYQQAVQQAYPDSTVQAVFLTSQGQIRPLQSDERYPEESP